MELLFGIAIWQTITFLVCLITSRKSTCKSITAMCGMGIWAILLLGINRTYEAIRRAVRRARYKALMFDPNKQLCYCDSEEADHYLEHGYTFATELRHKYSIDDGWYKYDCALGAINLRYTPIKIIQKENAYRIK